MTAPARRSAFEASRARGLSPIVGRDNEMGILFDRMARAADGAGQVVLISGEPGIGKSRLTQSLRDARSSLALEYRCSVHFQHTALYPVIMFLERALQFERGQTPSTPLLSLRAFLQEAQVPLDEAWPPLASLLSLPPPPDCPALTLNSAQQRQRTLAVLLNLTSMVRPASHYAWYGKTCIGRMRPRSNLSAC